MFDHLRDTLAYNVADLLAEPILSGEIESIQKAKELFKSCMDEGTLLFFFYLKPVKRIYH